MSLTARDGWILLRLSRPVNLLIAALTFTLAAYLSGLHHTYFVWSRLYWHQLAVLMGIMAGGYWINDVYDRRIDQVNKPRRSLVSVHISAKKVVSAYLVSVLVCLLATAWLPLKYLLLNTAALGALHLYARYWKRAAILGNLAIALLAALVVLAGGFVFYLRLSIVWGMVFAFLSTLLREITKDVEDMRGDMQFGLRTFPILMGIGRSKQLLGAFYLLLALALQLPFWVYGLGWYGVWLWGYQLYLWVVLYPLLGLCGWLLWRARKPAHFGLQSLLLKLLMLLGLGSLLLMP